MKKRLLTNSVWFRLLMPLITGFVAYMVILMSSDRLSQLGNLFFGTELLITEIASFLVFSVVRLFAVFIFPVQDGEELNVRTISLQVLATTIAGMLLAALPITVYMKFILGYSSFSRELSFFVVIFGTSVMFYNLFYFSLYYLNKKNTSALEHEQHLHDTLLKEFNGFVRDVHPEFFSLGMETLLVLIRKDKNEADKYINKFSGVFRYIIECKKNELTLLSEEMRHLENLLFVFNHKYDGCITIENKLTVEADNYKLVPCSLHCLIEQIVFSSVITKDSRLNIIVSAEGEGLRVEHNGMERIEIDENNEKLSQLSESQTYLTGAPITVEKRQGTTVFRFPVLVEEIEPLE